MSVEMEVGLPRLVVIPGAELIQKRMYSNCRRI